jgi:putative membrane protein
MRSCKTLGGILIATAFAATAFAQQTGNPAVTSPDSPKARDAPAPTDHPNTVDQIFTRQVAIGGMAEVELGKLAGARSRNDAVKRFARQMVDDHSKANERLVKIGKANEALIPKSPDRDPDVQAVRAQLDKLNGAPFDVAYMSAQVGDHQKTAHLLEHEIGSGQDAKAKAYAIETLPTVLRHLEMAQDVLASVSGSATRGDPVVASNDHEH